MICRHQFVRIGEAAKFPPGNTVRAMQGAEVGCANCGQVRRVWPDGTVEVVADGGKPLEEDAA